MKNSIILSTLSCLPIMLYACSEPTQSEEGLPDDYPDQEVEVSVGFQAGGGTDLSARNMVEALNENNIVDQSFVVENNPAGGGRVNLQELGNIGDEYRISPVPDFGSSIFSGEVDLEFEDVTPIAQVATDYQIIAVREDSEYDNIEELLSDMRDDPGSINIGIAGNVTDSEAWRWEDVAEQIDAEGELNFVTLEGGSETLTSLLSGDIDVTVVVPQLGLDHIEEGNLRPLAVMTDEEVEDLPDVPTLKDQGVDVTYYRPRGFWMSGDVSEEVADYWESAFQEAVETEIWQDYIESADLLPEFQGREEYTNFIQEEGNRYGEWYESIDDN